MTTINVNMMQLLSLINKKFGPERTLALLVLKTDDKEA